VVNFQRCLLKNLVIFACCLTGQWLPPGALSGITGFLLAAAVVSELWFMTVLFQEYRPRRFWHGVIWFYGIAVSGLPLLQFVGLHRESLYLLNSVIPLGLLVLMLTLLTAQGAPQRPPIPRSWLFVYLVFYGAMNSIPPLTHLGLLAENPVILFGNVSHLVMDGLVMIVLLQLRARILARQQDAIAKALLRSEEQARLERQHREEQAKLLAMLAHEVKTPLASLSMWMDAGQLKPEVMERAISDMNLVIERCVHAGQLADEGLRPLPQRLDAIPLTSTLAESCREPGRLVLDLPAAPDDLPDDLPAELLADGQMLSIVLANLLDNACKYSAPGSLIRLKLRPENHTDGRPGWCWELANQVGQAGFPDAERLYDKYYRSAHAKRQSGSGLRLFLVKGLLELMGGEIRYSREGEEILFRLWLPVEVE
jgi:signal transduction histidine kinase